MMKKLFAFLLLISILSSIMVCPANAESDNLAHLAERMKQLAGEADLPTLDEALVSMNAKSGRIEISDKLEDYDPDNFGEIDFGQFRLVILERWLPEKEFTEYDSGYPDNYIPDLPDDFTGVDIGESRVWLRCDMMNMLPEEFRASSLDEADILIIAESQYFLSGTISVSDFYYSDDEEIPEFETIEEMEAYIAEHQPVIRSITYYPKFGAYALIDFYSAVTKTSQVYDYTVTYPRRFARNPAAQDIWYGMEALADVMDALSAPDIDRDFLFAAFEELETDDYVPEAKTGFWKNCVEQGEYQAAFSSVNEYYWTMAAELSAADPNEKHQANYSMIIEEQDRTALAAFASFCDYSGFDTPVETIRDNKEYLAVPDYDWLETALSELMAELI